MFVRDAFREFELGREVDGDHLCARAIDGQAAAGARAVERERGDDQHAAALYGI